MTLGKIIDADKIMNPQHFGSDPANTWIQIRINPEVGIRILDHFWLRLDALLEVLALLAWSSWKWISSHHINYRFVRHNHGKFQPNFRMLLLFLLHKMLKTCMKFKFLIQKVSLAVHHSTQLQFILRGAVDVLLYVRECALHFVINGGLTGTCLTCLNEIIKEL